MFWRSPTNHISLKWRSLARLNAVLCWRTHKTFAYSTVGSLSWLKWQEAIQLQTSRHHRDSWPPSDQNDTHRAQYWRRHVRDGGLESEFEASEHRGRAEGSGSGSTAVTAFFITQPLKANRPTAQHLHAGGRSRALPKFLHHNTRSYCCFCREFTFICLIITQ